MKFFIADFLYRVITMKFYRFTADFLFLKDKKLKKLVIALKFVYFHIVLSLNSNVIFASFIFL